MAGPLNRLGVLLEHVRRGEFNTESTRSGRWTTWATGKSHEASGSSPTEVICTSCLTAIEEIDGKPASICVCGEKVHTRAPCTRTCPGCERVWCAKCFKYDEVVCESCKAEGRGAVREEDHGEESDSDTDNDESASLPVEYGGEVAGDMKVTVPDKLGSDQAETLWTRKISGITHRARDDVGGMSGCGIVMGSFSFEAADLSMTLTACRKRLFPKPFLEVVGGTRLLEELQASRNAPPGLMERNQFRLLSTLGCLRRFMIVVPGQSFSLARLVIEGERRLGQPCRTRSSTPRRACGPRFLR